MKGVTVTLKQKTQTGTDDLGQPIYTTTDVHVNDVLVGEPSTSDIENAMTMYGKRIAYTLALPKGDKHTWYKNQVVLPEPFCDYKEETVSGAKVIVPVFLTFNVIGDATAGIEENIPLRWNKKVHLERLEG